MTAGPSTSTSCTDRSTGSRCLGAEIIEHAAVGAQHRRIVVHAPELAASAQPGQFVHVSCMPQGAYDPLLRRPLGIHFVDADSGRVGLLYEVVGRGTSILSEKCPGHTLDLIGPLGNGFTLPASAHQPVLLLAGGIGVAPLYYLAERIADIVSRERISVIIGARTSEMLLCVDDFKQITSDVRIATDDGTCGYHGFTTGLLDEYVKAIDPGNPPLIYACGPMPMLAGVAEISGAHALKCQVSTEAKMACGIGACMSCVIKIHAGDSFKYLRACKEGPVFDADEIMWGGA